MIETIRVASVPASHLYVRHLSHPDGREPVTRLDDPMPSDGATVPHGWWPPVMLEPAWIEENHELFDVFHIHFGFDAISTDTLCEVIDRLTRHHKPLIYTVHDLRNPHQPLAEQHEKQQDVLVPAADGLITLTPGAAEVIRARWGKSPAVQPHPHVLDPDHIRRARRPSSKFVVGVHVKSLRANIDPFPVLDALVGTIGDIAGATLQVDVHDQIFDPTNYYYAPLSGDRLLSYDRYAHVDVRVHPYFTDNELWQYLSSLTVSVLPYRFGTHSGWLEACYDLGTAVIAPSCGFYGEQRPCELFGYSETSFDAEALDRAVRTLHRRFTEGTAPPRATWGERRAERIDISRGHAALYERTLS